MTCARKEVRLQTEPGFYAVAPLDPPDDVERMTLEAAAHSPFDATDIGLRATVSPDPGAKGNLRLEIRIDAADLLLPQTQDRRTGKISLLFAAYQAAGWGQPGPPIPLDISLTPEQYETVMHNGIELHRALPAGSAIRKVRAIVVDGELGAVGSLTIPIQH